MLICSFPPACTAWGHSGMLEIVIKKQKAKRHIKILRFSIIVVPPLFARKKGVTFFTPLPWKESLARFIPTGKLLERIYT
jgi:hypothetical protein